MKTSLLDVLVAPGDHASLSVAEGERSDGGDLIEGALSADGGKLFPVRDGVPRMVPAEQNGSGPSQEATAESFGAKWERLRDQDRGRLSEMQYAWFDERYGFDGDAGLAEHLKGRERILDAGTGSGLHAARFARLADGDVIGMDLSSSVGRAQSSFAEAPNLQYVQGDILDPPFGPDSFDLVVSDQVIHHTPDCHRAFATLAGLLRPGGEIAVYVYKVKPLVREMADTEVRNLTTKLSVEDCWEFSEQITELGRALSELDAKVTLKTGVPLLGIEPGEHDVQRLIYWTLLKCYWNEELGEDLSTLVNFDWYHPPYASRHTEEELRGWCGELGLEVRHVDVMESGISIRATRPA